MIPLVSIYIDKFVMPLVLALEMKCDKSQRKRYIKYDVLRYWMCDEGLDISNVFTSF